MSALAPVGVFDSGVGGLSILRALRAALPGERFVYVADSAAAPYGERGDAFVIDRSRRIVEGLREDHGVRAVVIACNTATAAAVQRLREEHPGLPFVGVEPALKPAAALTRTGRVGVMATRGTCGSARLRALRESLAGRADFVVQACDGLADAIESGDASRIAALCGEHLAAMGNFGDAPGQIDTLVLGCTHYVFALDEIRACVGPSVRVIETGEPVAAQARRLLEGGHPAEGAAGRVTLLATGDDRALRAAAQRWL